MLLGAYAAVTPVSALRRLLCDTRQAMSRTTQSGLLPFRAAGPFALRSLPHGLAIVYVAQPVIFCDASVRRKMPVDYARLCRARICCGSGLFPNLEDPLIE